MARMGESTFHSLYFHFPFCETKCHYCDFYSLAEKRTNQSDRDRYAKALKTEVEIYSDRIGDIKTIFFGGGTPSMTNPKVMESVMKPIRDRITSTVEWTSEANPSSLDSKNLAAFRDLGINRISMGIQSLQDHHLKTLGRVHSSKQALETLDTIFQAGFENVSVDLICGVPNQSLEELRFDLETLSNFPIQHLSCYLLTLPKHHPMYKDLPGEKVQIDHLEFVDSFLKSKGFEHYEISNFAKPGRQARHNLVYWLGDSYLALGPSGHSFDSRTRTRWKNYSSINRYSESLMKSELPVEWEEKLTNDQVRLEKWMLALRLNREIRISDISANEREKLRQLSTNGYLDHSENGFKPNLSGWIVSDQLAAEIAN